MQKWCRSIGDQCGLRSCVGETEKMKDGRNVWDVYAAVARTSKNQSEGKGQAGRLVVLLGQIEPSVD